MPSAPTVQHLTGDRLHLQHGPIDIVLKAWGEPAALAAAYRAAIGRFETILTELVAELAELKRPIADAPRFTSAVARRMVAACQPFSDHFITPMAAVAGSVADEILSVMLDAAPGLARAYVNDGGDIAVHIAPGAALTLGIAGDFSGGEIPNLNGGIRLTAGLGIGGVATSGARGRSFSLGIADSVTVLAHNAAAADAAATIIANAVDIDSPRVIRRPAADLDPDTDLGRRLVTVSVALLADDDIDRALSHGRRTAEDLLRRRLIVNAALMLQGQICVVPGFSLAPSCFSASDLSPKVPG